MTMTARRFANPALAAAIAALTLSSILSAQPAATAGRTCPDVVRLLEAALPKEVGDSAALGKLLAPRVGPQLSQTFDAAKAAAALGDQLTAARPCCNEPAADTAHKSEQRFTGAAGSSLENDLDNGRITYLNPGRSFDASKSPDNKVERQRALDSALSVLRAFGVQAAELDTAADVRAIKLAGRGTERDAKPIVRRVEVSVLVPRRIEGVPVFDSTAKAVIDAKGQVARLHLAWPDFAIAEGLTAQGVRPRAEVLRELAATLSESDPCDSLERIDLRLAYVSLAELDRDQGADDEKEGAAVTVPRARFAPALVVYALPRSVPEDSGRLQSAGLQIVTPLFALPGGDTGKPRAGR